ncbi:MAG: VWA domain-containing protein [Leptospiraceae bacterium]|nr:VWA domain-containing protein [Leptospiraceae bacterium]MCP5512857.1 VWA domain-containing protein [Leptospiraceae bacterium]
MEKMTLFVKKILTCTIKTKSNTYLRLWTLLELAILLSLLHCSSTVFKSDSNPIQPDTSQSQSQKDLDARTTQKNPEYENQVMINNPDSAARRFYSENRQAGFTDDNKQFNYFVNFLKKYDTIPHYPLNISERIVFNVQDQSGNSVPFAKIKIQSDSKLLEVGQTYSDGSFIFHPSEYPDSNKYIFQVEKSGTREEIPFWRNGNRKIPVQLKTQRSNQSEIPIDIVFVFDTTGSMGEEIARLKATIELIDLNLSSLPKVSVRFGLVLYRDREEEYVTKLVPLTNDLEAFRKELNKVEAEGGGDNPEDLQTALKDAVLNINWREDSIKMGFVITDAPPHLDYNQSYTYIHAAKDAKKKGIKLFTIGTGGLDIQGEYVLRQISQYTNARYIFLTYGDTADNPSLPETSVSRHIGANFATDKLESIIIRFSKEEYFHATGKSLSDVQTYYLAKKIQTESREDTLKKLFIKGFNELIDFSSETIPDSTRITSLPLFTEKTMYQENSNILSSFLEKSLQEWGSFPIVNREDKIALLRDWKYFHQNRNELELVSRYANLTGANYLISGQVEKKKDFTEVYLRLYRASGGETLSITKLVLDKDFEL